MILSYTSLMLSLMPDRLSMPADTNLMADFRLVTSSLSIYAHQRKLSAAPSFSFAIFYFVIIFIDALFTWASIGDIILYSRHLLSCREWYLLHFTVSCRHALHLAIPIFTDAAGVEPCVFAQRKSNMRPYFPSTSRLARTADVATCWLLSYLFAVLDVSFGPARREHACLR